MDLTIGDYVTYLKNDPEIELFAVYVEGFKPLDGLRFLSAAREISEQGRTVLLYRAGRTSAGATAASSHTASISGDYVVTRELARNAGVIVCDTIQDFSDLVRLFVLLIGKKVKGFRLGALSNAGFECVAAADNLGYLQLSPFTERTRRRVHSMFKECNIDRIVDLHNPIDLTPMTDDACCEEVVRAVLEDETVDVAVVGCVPLTPTLQTLPPERGHEEDLYRRDSIPMRLIRLNDEVEKPLVVTIDAGKAYDAMAALMEINGIPTFRTMDRALSLLSRFCYEKMKRTALKEVNQMNEVVEEPGSLRMKKYGDVVEAEKDGSHLHYRISEPAAEERGRVVEATPREGGGSGGTDPALRGGEKE
jgi:acyl-CoA synthetase (NDP forming)